MKQKLLSDRYKPRLSEKKDSVTKSFLCQLENVALWLRLSPLLGNKQIRALGSDGDSHRLTWVFSRQVPI